MPTISDAASRALYNEHPADHMLSIMLSLIDSAMNTTDENPVVFKITPQELNSWAEAVETYENWRFFVQREEA